MKKQIRFLVEAGLIAALYAGLTYLSNLFNLAFGPVQLRLSEVLTVLPVLTPAAVPGLTVGCFLANILSFNPLDLLFGTAATLAAAVATRLLGKIKIGSWPILALLPPVLLNAVIIGLEIALFYTDSGAGWGFGAAALSVGAGQLLVCYGLGLPFYKLVIRTKLFANDRK